MDTKKNSLSAPMARRLHLPFVTFLALLLSSNIIAQEVWTDKSRVLPDKLRLLSTTLTLYHSPNPNFPILNKDTENEAKYVWKHSTTICSPFQDLEIVEAGSFIWFNENGWHENLKLSKKDVIKRFDCPGGLLKKGISYTYAKNYRYGDQLYGGDALWFVIAKDKEGKLYKGFGIIETEGEIQND